MPTLSLYGRDAELGVLDDLSNEVREHGRTLVVRGEAGIGKSALLAEASRRARDSGMQVLSTTGVQSEAHLTFAGLHQLLQPLLVRIDELPVPHRDALKAAFGMTDTAAPELFLIALATLELLADAAARSPLLVIAEDAQWLDRPSSEVLAFVARRVNLEPIVVLVAIREGAMSPFEAAGLPELQLQPLDEVAAAALLDAQVSSLAPDVRERVLHESAGNPLALVELPSVFRSRHVDGTALPSEPLPLTARLERAFAERSVELPPATRTALLVAAANDGDDLAVVLRAAGAVYKAFMPADALQPAIAGRLIEIDHAGLSFRHPLVRSAIYGAATVPERHAAHARSPRR